MQITFTESRIGYIVTINKIFICYTSHRDIKLVSNYAYKRGFESIDSLYYNNLKLGLEMDYE